MSCLTTLPSEALMSKQTSEKLKRWADGKLLIDIDLSLCAFELGIFHIQLSNSFCKYI